MRFIQVGAYDGQFQDPLYNWICHHPWLGVLVEPQPAMYERLIRLHASHPFVSVERAVVAEKTGKATLWTLSNVTGPAEDATPLASLKREVVERNKHLSSLADHVSSIEVDAYTLYDLMIKHRFDELDLLQIDAEGSDFDIIKTIDFTKCRPQVINYEHVNLTFDDWRASRTYLADFGYSFALSYPWETIACGGEVLAGISKLYAS